jgi:hypothetical protein
MDVSQKLTIGPFTTVRTKPSMLMILLFPTVEISTYFVSVFTREGVAAVASALLTWMGNSTLVSGSLHSGIHELPKHGTMGT